MSTDLPENVKQAIHQNRKIEAIKLLREHAGVGLKEAKQQVEDYSRSNPEKISKKVPAQSQGGINLLLVIGVVVIAYGVYQLIK